MRVVAQTSRSSCCFDCDGRAVSAGRRDGRRVSGAVLDQGPPIGLVTSDDDENVAVDEDHEDERSEEETGVLPTKAQLSDEIRFASLRLFECDRLS